MVESLKLINFWRGTQMKCIICSNEMSYYFTKYFGTDSLGDVEYARCVSCGFCASSTHFEMSASDWESLNTSWHSDNNARADNPWNRSQRHFNQSLMLYLLARQGVLSRGDWLDYASGVGGLSSQLYRHFDLTLHNFDKFIEPKIFPLSQLELVNRGYCLVTNTAMFEHVRDRDTLDQIESYVSKNGCFGIHTLVREEIPADPNWMYLLPVHCAFHTNKSMGILMRQWGYSCSVYNENAKMWVWFRRKVPDVEDQVRALNASLGWEYLHFKEGFMDYWP